MKLSKILIIAVLLTIATAISAGCTGSGQTSPAEDTSQAAQTAAEVVQAPEENPASQDEGGLKPGNKVNSTDVFGRNYSWCEYQENLTSETPCSGMYQSITFNRIERTVDDYSGAPAIHYRSVSKSESRNQVSDYYYDTTMNNLLGGKLISTRNGQIHAIENFTAEPLNQENRPFGEKIHTFVYQGTESVTVPAGTYPEARKYFHYNSDNTVGCTYWFAADIPVPVLYQYSPEYFDGKNAFMSVELTGWG